MRKLATATASLVFAAALGLAMSAPSAYAKGKVDCDQVMQQLNSGKKPKDVAKDLKISTSSVYGCKRKAKRAAKAGAKVGKETSPAAAPH